MEIERSLGGLSAMLVLGLVGSAAQAAESVPSRESHVVCPDSCSVIGSWGQSGCTQQLIRQWRAERRARTREPR